VTIALIDASGSLRMTSMQSPRWILFSSAASTLGSEDPSIDIDAGGGRSMVVVLPPLRELAGPRRQQKSLGSCSALPSPTSVSSGRSRSSRI
jgi:hypothetical protein